MLFPTLSFSKQDRQERDVLSLYPFSGELLFETVTFCVPRIARNKAKLLLL